MKQRNGGAIFGNPTDDDSKEVEESDDEAITPYWNLVVREAQAVSLWSCVCLLIRLLVALLANAAPYRDVHWSHEQDRQKCSVETCAWTWAETSSTFVGGIFKIFSVVASWILLFAPTKLVMQQAPGFIFANPWILLWVCDKTQVVPNVSVRACEYMLGRLRLFELLLILPVHFATVVSTSVFLQRVLPENLALTALKPVVYADGDNPFVVDFVCEVVVSAVFSVALLVVPVLLDLNRLPQWLIVLILFPLFIFSVDSVGTASSFAPNVLLAFDLLDVSGKPLPANGGRIVGSIFAGLVGGKVMQRVFPDGDHTKTK